MKFFFNDPHNSGQIEKSYYMKFLFNGGAYPNLLDSLKQLGHTIVEHDLVWLNYTGSTDKAKQYNALLKNKIAQTKPDVYVCSKGFREDFRIYPETHEWINRNVGMTIYWSMDDPFFMRTFINNKLYCGYRIALTCTTDSFDSYTKVGLKPYLFWPAFDTTMRKFEVIKEEDKLDFVFVGTPYDCTDVPRKKLVLGLLHNGIRNIELYGSRAWISNKAMKRNNAPFISGEPDLDKFYKGECPFADVHLLYNRAKLNLSNHVVKAKLYLNDRVPMIMGVGGFLFLDKNPGLEKQFLHEEDVVYYNNYEDFIKKAKYYILRPDLRNAIGVNARNKILRSHTYKQRAEQLLRILAENGLK